MNIGDLRVGMRRVNVTGVIESISEVREVQSRFTGKLHKVATATLSDETGKIDLVLWDDQISQVSVGNQVKVENGYVSRFRGRKQLSIGRYGKITVV